MTGTLVAIPIEDYNYEYDIANGYCKIAYVCKGNVQYARQELYSFLKDLPNSEARYNMLCYYGGQGGINNAENTIYKLTKNCSNNRR